MYGFHSSSSLNQRRLKWSNSINDSSSRTASIAHSDHKTPDIISVVSNHPRSDLFEETVEVQVPEIVEVLEPKIVNAENNTPITIVNNSPNVSQNIGVSATDITSLLSMMADMKHMMTELARCIEEVKSLKVRAVEDAETHDPVDIIDIIEPENVGNLEDLEDLGSLPKVFVPFNDSFEYACNDNETHVENNKLIMSLCVPNYKTLPLTLYPFGLASDVPSFENNMLTMSFTDEKGISGVVYGDFSRDKGVYKIVASDWYHNGGQISMDSLTFPILIKCECDL